MHGEYAAVAAEAVLKAGAIQKARYGQKIEIRHKGEIDLVTEVDRACEDAILATLRSRFPDHDIVTEETDLARTGSRHVWFIDPAGRHHQLRPRLSVLLRLGGPRDRRRDRGGRRLRSAARRAVHGRARRRRAPRTAARSRVSASSELLISALLVTGFPYDLRDDLAGEAAPLQPLHGPRPGRPPRRRRRPRPLLRARPAASTASGRSASQPWDMMAGALIVEEAGGRVTRFDGSPLGLERRRDRGRNGPGHRP